VLICTDLGGGNGLGPFSGGQFAYLVKCTIEGLARGCVPCAAQWRLPPLFRSGIRFQPQPTYGKGLENFRLPFDVYQRRQGDCDQLVIYRLWELYVHGVQAICRAEWIGDRVHVLVRLPNGQLEDPSLILGATTR